MSGKLLLSMYPRLVNRVDLDTALKVSPHVVSRVVDDETVLLNLEGGLYFGVDQVGHRIWELTGEGKTLQEIVDAIVAEYDVSREQAEGDVLAFAEPLVERGLLGT